ncbi:type II toxin-antitoxin system RelE/ParE family toxin [Rhizorhapis suberifaciens]|uniref:Toxin ParE1/3/4 n=1 Tax=Rhizorhapis suberifaciens TaxID=13656 RepID=A0A840HS89_9SPHN|nr:type II toxin-antitoxin system RelE/ParE family toxin [Rhizorhapis suberifaciens]MBB4640855.1 toxin ParE1/3/4 [Rhizorhapis suberifaciens]
MTARYQVVLSEQAIEDITSIGRWITDEADLETAIAYVSRIEAFCLKLCDFPRRGALRDDLMVGVRTVSFERRVVVAYRIDGRTVSILRAVSGARDVARLFDDS